MSGQGREKSAFVFGYSQHNTLIYFSKREKGLAEAQSSFLNTAYKTLLSPSLRAQYILSQVGFPTSETDKLSDVDLITEIMDAHEELDVSRTPEEVDMISESNDCTCNWSFICYISLLL